MIDLHSHTFYSDGELVPAEQARRAEIKGVEVLGITDHADASNVEEMVEKAKRAKGTASLPIVPGVEITHVPPEKIPDVVDRARDAGAEIVVAHGESPVEPVSPGTNRASIESGVDLLGHPGMITMEDAKMAAEEDVYLELSARRGHSLANGHVTRIANEVDADLIVSTDAHHPDDFISQDRAHEIARYSGLKDSEADKVVVDNPRDLLESL